MFTLGKPLPQQSTTSTHGQRVRIIPSAASNPITQRILTIRQQRLDPSSTRRPGLITRLSAIA